MTDWIGLVAGSGTSASEWQGILVAEDSETLLDLGRRLSAQLGCYLKAVRKNPAAGVDKVLPPGDLEAIIREERPEIVLFGADSAMAAALAQKLKTGLASASAVELDVATRLLVCRSPGYGGKLIEEYVCPEARPQMVIVT